MRFQRSKSTLDSLKRVFNVFRRKPLLGAPDIYSVTTEFAFMCFETGKKDEEQGKYLKKNTVRFAFEVDSRR